MRFTASAAAVAGLALASPALAWPPAAIGRAVREAAARLALSRMAAKPPDKPTARSVFYTGRVQGVGFRAATVSISRSYRVAGWVKNLPDGRVELVVEGKAEVVEAFLAEVRRTFARNIDKEEARPTAPTGKYKMFTVEY
jgi:acylphosphatase